MSAPLVLSRGAGALLVSGWDGTALAPLAALPYDGRPYGCALRRCADDRVIVIASFAPRRVAVALNTSDASVTPIADVPGSGALAPQDARLHARGRVTVVEGETLHLWEASGWRALSVPRGLGANGVSFAADDTLWIAGGAGGRPALFSALPPYTQWRAEPVPLGLLGGLRARWIEAEAYELVDVEALPWVLVTDPPSPFDSASGVVLEKLAPEVKTWRASWVPEASAHVVRHDRRTFLVFADGRVRRGGGGQRRPRASIAATLARAATSRRGMLVSACSSGDTLLAVAHAWEPEGRAETALVATDDEGRAWRVVHRGEEEELLAVSA